MSKLNREFLKDLGIVDKDVIDAILNEHSKIIVEVKKELNTVNAKIEFLNQQKEELTNELKDRDGQLEGLKNSTEDVAGLKKTIEDLQNTNKTNDEAHKNEINDLKKSFAIEKELSNAKARNVISVKALLKLDEIELNEDGSLKGLSEQIETLKSAEDSKFLFDTETRNLKGVIPEETGIDDPSTNIDLSKMTYDERNAYFEGDFD